MRFPIPAMALLVALGILWSGCTATILVGQKSEAEKHIDAGVELHKQGRFQEAIAEFDQAIRLDPKLALAYSNRGHAYNSLSLQQWAIQDLDEAIRLDPKLAAAYNNRGNVYLRLNQPQRAIQDLDEAIRLDPKVAVAYANRALAYTALGREGEAQRDVDRAVQLGFDPSLLKGELEKVKSRQ